MIRIVLLILPLFLFCTLALSGNMRKCIDSEGNVTFTQASCPDNTAHRQSIYVPPAQAPYQGLKSSQPDDLGRNKQPDHQQPQETEQNYGQHRNDEQEEDNSADLCIVATFELHDNQVIKAGVGTDIGGGLVQVPIRSTTERCAQIRIKCDGFGSRIIEANDLTAEFADGKQRTGKGGFESFRLSGGESKAVYTCFGSSDAPIVSIDGQF